MISLKFGVDVVMEIFAGFNITQDKELHAVFVVEDKLTNIKYFFENKLTAVAFLCNFAGAGLGDGFAKVHLAADVEVEVILFGVRKKNLSVLNNHQTNPDFDLWLHMGYILHHAHMVNQTRKNGGCRGGIGSET